MSSISKKEPTLTRHDRKAEPSESFLISPEIVTVASDFCRAITDPATGICTLQFYRTRVTPSQDGKLVDRVVHMGFLEVKLPATQAFGLGVYLYQLLKDLREHPEKQKGTFFGPTGITEGPASGESSQVP